MKPLLDVLMILDALEKEGSFAAASAKLYTCSRVLVSSLGKLNIPSMLPQVLMIFYGDP